MSNPRQQISGLFNILKSKASRKKPSQRAADYTTKEEKAVALTNQGKLQEAEAIYRELVTEGTQDHNVFFNLATICRMQGRFDELIKLLLQILDLNPNFPKAHNNMGVAHQEQGDLTAAIASYNSALRLDPNYPEAHFNLGNAVQEQGDLTAAIASYNSALRLKLKLKLKLNYLEVHWNSSLTMVLGCDYKNGWEEYEWRTKRQQKPIMPHAMPKCNKWRSNVALNQPSQLLLVTEQGLGDTRQLMRYATALRNEGISVSLCA